MTGSDTDVAAAAAAAVEQRLHAEREEEAARLLAPIFEGFAGRRRHRQATLATHKKQAGVYLHVLR